MKYAAILLLSAFHTAIFAQAFPTMTMEQLDGKTLSVPEGLKGKKSILFLAMSPAAENMLSRWYEPIYIMFLDKSGFNSMAYDCHVELVMTFTGAAKSAANKIKESLRQNIDEEMANHLLFYEGSIAELKALGVEKKNNAYVVVLDESGNIIALETGAYSEKKLEKIADLVEL